jgi:hypothetical protein
MPLPLLSAVNALPVPALNVFEFRDRRWLAQATRAAGRANHHAAQPGRRALKRLVQVK